MARDFDLGISGPPLAIAHGLHRDRSRRHGGRHRAGDRARRLRVVGAARARRRVGVDALVAPRELGVARPQHRRGARSAAPRRLRVPPRGRSTGREGAAPVRPLGLDGRAVLTRRRRLFELQWRSDAIARAIGGVVRSRWSWPPTASCSGRSPTPPLRGSLSLGTARRVRDRGRRYQLDRVRWSQLGARRRVATGGRGAAARRVDGRGRRAPPSALAPPPGCRRARSACATSRSRTRRTSGPCSMAST